METQEIEIDQGDEDCQETEFSMIPVQLVETYNNVSLASPTGSNIGLNKVKYYKYYKQTYRPAWEQMPDFKGIALNVFDYNLKLVLCRLAERC